MPAAVGSSSALDSCSHVGCKKVQLFGWTELAPSSFHSATFRNAKRPFVISGPPRFINAVTRRFSIFSRWGLEIRAGSERKVPKNLVRRPVTC
jgi:hypothetical protein